MIIPRSVSFVYDDDNAAFHFLLFHCDEEVFLKIDTSKIENDIFLDSCQGESRYQIHQSGSVS